MSKLGIVFLRIVKFCFVSLYLMIGLLFFCFFFGLIDFSIIFVLLSCVEVELFVSSNFSRVVVNVRSLDFLLMIIFYLGLFVVCLFFFLVGWGKKYCLLILEVDLGDLSSLFSLIEMDFL